MENDKIKLFLVALGEGGRISVCRDDKDRAKEIFIAYHGNHFQMEREGVYSEYKKLKITKAGTSMDS